MIPNIVLLDINPEMTEAWSRIFCEDENIEIVNSELKAFLKNNKDIDGVVSPANSFGLMDGGYDKAITEYFGPFLYNAVQNTILDEYYGEQPVGTCIKVDIPGSNICLLHAPSMRTPEHIIDPRVIYSCMRCTLVVAVREGLKKIVVPAFGGLTGAVPPRIIAYLMKQAYEDVVERTQTKYLNTWENIRVL